jgi:hypothetical protein
MTVSNVLPNGTVLPHGLLSGGSNPKFEAFKKTFQNTALRVGIIMESYPIDDDDNLNGLFPEYDVMSFEQNEDQGSTTITYKHCLASSSFGSVADFFEANLRKMERNDGDGVTPDFAKQNGAIVLLLCLNGMSDTGIIISSLAHPDRETTLQDGDPHLEGEYNGVRVKVESDGSTSLVFKGATDNDGEVIDESQGDTTIQIETDGSFQVDHDTITFRMDRSGVVTLNAKDEIDITTDTDLNINVQGDVNITVNGDATVNVDGKADVQIGADANVQVGGDCNLTSSGKTVVQASEINLNGQSGMILTTVTDPVIDTIFGVPTTGVPTVKSG